MNNSEKKIQPSNNINNNNITLTINSGVVTQVYSQLFSSMSDFYGLLIGSVKNIKNKRAIDSDYNFEQINHYFNISFVIFIFDKRYLETEKFVKLLEKIENKYKDTDNELLGIFSARSYSYANMSFKDQDLYKKASQNFTKNNLPLLFGVFTHNVPEINSINSIKSIEMNTRFFIIDSYK